MTDEELLRHSEEVDRCYAEAAAFDAARHVELPEDEQEEPYDPMAWGWVGKDGRP